MTNYTKTNEKRKTVLQQRSKGKSVICISQETGIPISTIYYWISKEKAEKEKRVSDPCNYHKQLTHIQRLEQIIEVLKEVIKTIDISLELKLKILESYYIKDEYSVRVICEALSVPRGTFYNYIFRGKKGQTKAVQRRIMLSDKIQKIYDESNQIYGANKIHAILKEQGEVVSANYVSDIMKELNLKSIRNGSKKQHYDEKKKCQNFVNRNFNVKEPNKTWVSDVTYYNFKEHTYYICVIMDLFSRKIIAYKIGKKNSTQLLKATIKSALKSRTIDSELIFHSDRGSNYTSRDIRNYLTSNGIKQSFSQAGVPYDNSVMEAFFANLKREELYRSKYHSEREFRESVDRYIDFYNNRRPHKTIHYKTPSAKEVAYYEANKK